MNLFSFLGRYIVLSRKFASSHLPLSIPSGLIVSGGVPTATLTSIYPERTITTSWLTASSERLRLCCSLVRYPGMVIYYFLILYYFRHSIWNHQDATCTFQYLHLPIFLGINLQHHLCIFWWWDPKPGSPVHHRQDPWNSFQAGESTRWGWGHAWGQPYTWGKVKAGGLQPCWGEPFLYWSPGEYYLWIDQNKRLYTVELQILFHIFNPFSLCRTMTWEFWEETTVLTRLWKPLKRLRGCAQGGCLWTSCLDAPGRLLNPGRMSWPSC